MVDKERVTAKARALAREIGIWSGELRKQASTTSGLERAFDTLVAKLEEIANRYTPRRKPNRGFRVQ